MAEPTDEEIVAALRSLVETWSGTLIRLNNQGDWAFFIAVQTLLGVKNGTIK